MVTDFAVRAATAGDSAAVQAIYAPIVRDTVISFEVDPPTVTEIARRIETTTASLPWLVAETQRRQVVGYAYASHHRERAAYRWSVDVSVYIHDSHRGRGAGRRLYNDLLAELAKLGYAMAFAGITLPNAASVRLHEGCGFAPLGVFSSVGYKLGRWCDVGWWQKRLRADALEAPEPPHRWSP